MGEQCGAAIQQRAAQNQQAVHIQRRLRVVRERGIDGNGERAEGDGAKARSGGAQKGKHEGEQREGERYSDRMLEGELNRQRGDGEGDNGKAEVFEFAGQPVVQIHQAAGDNAQKQRRKIRAPVVGIHNNAGNAAAEQNGKAVDEFGVNWRRFHGAGCFWCVRQRCFSIRAGQRTRLHRWAMHGRTWLRHGGGLGAGVRAKTG